MSARRASRDGTENATIASLLREVAELLEAQGANRFRVRAWRNGAATIEALERPARSLLAEQGLEALDQLPDIGPALARAIREIIETGRLATLERLRGGVDPEALLATVPGIGPALARRVHDALGVETLEELEAAAHDGRLASVGGFGRKRTAGIVDALAERLRRRKRELMPATDQPAVAELLDVDREYRDGAASRSLPTIAPRRFNPEHERWLPVLHTSRGGRHYTALFSNTATAHRLGRTHDWVVLYYDGPTGEHQVTVVTAPKGPMAKRRVVRGREQECIAHYHASTAA